MDTELYELLTELGRAGFLVHSYEINHEGPLVVAAVLNRGHWADVVILHGPRCAYAYRTPSGDGQDVLYPDRVVWDCSGAAARALKALLALPEPAEQTTPVALRAAERGLCLPAEQRKAPMRSRRRGT